MDRLDLRLVTYFIAVAEELHFGRAAERLHIAQPSLSQQIRQLEHQLGVTLLQRTSRRVELTRAGEALLREGRRTLAQAQRTIAATRSAARERLVVGFAGSAASDLLANALEAFAADHPTIEVSLRELALNNVDDIASGDVDIAFTRLLPGQCELELEIIAREPRFVALPTAHRLARYHAVSFTDLRDEAFIINPAARTEAPPARWLAEQRQHGLPGRVAAQAASIEEILTLVATNRGVCLVPDSVTRHHTRTDVVYIAVTDAAPAVTSLAWSRGNKRAAINAFRDSARRIATSASAAP
jgi:DNA-binding transcriptional LysR family regulator